jgi:threonine aldolase
MTGDLILRRDRAYRGASRMLTGHGRRTQAEWLRELAGWVEVNSGGVDPVADYYGAGPQVTDLEQEVAGLLGKPAAVLMPSGIMAQQAALRVWAERSGRETVGLHLKSHFLVHELDALRELHGLRPVVVTEAPRPTLANDLAGIPEPLGSLTVELPLRDCGYVLPAWEQLTELAAAAAGRGIFFHIDGARVWESAPFLGRDYAQIAGLGDSIYVSLYKGLGGLAGALLAGPEDFVADARRWRLRHGGNLPSLFPIAVAGRLGLQRYLPRMPAYVACARQVGAAIQDSGAGVTQPSPVHTNSFRIFLAVPAEALNAAIVEHAEVTGEWTFRDFRDTEVPGWAMSEFVAGEATLGWEPAEVADLLGHLRDLAAAAVRNGSGTLFF